MNCIEENCPNVAYVKKDLLCPTHYERQRSGGAERARDLNPMPTCSVSHCVRLANSRTEGSMCQAHYHRKWRGEDPEASILPEKPEQTNAQKCWVADCPRGATEKHLCKRHAKEAKMGVLQVPESLGIKVNPPCTFEGCERPRETRSLCHSHYDQMNRGEQLRPLRTYGRYIRGESACEITKCKKPATNKGMCTGHSRMLREYKIPATRLQLLMAIPECENPGCTNTARLHIDHDHETGIVRGMLCGGCNTSLGHLKEDIDRILGLAEYKRLHSNL